MMTCIFEINVGRRIVHSLRRKDGQAFRFYGSSSSVTDKILDSSEIHPLAPFDATHRLTLSSASGFRWNCALRLPPGRIVLVVDFSYLSSAVPFPPSHLDSLPRPHQYVIVASVNLWHYCVVLDDATFLEGGDSIFMFFVALCAIHVHLLFVFSLNEVVPRVFHFCH
ncbi:unnamed protein product [Soboliphyme baturini]|uniref:Uncharacterized protein n=1 Tax=Soboliphyme baturini TaxID=241478 RepID=A0A183IK69_9BILA|nr:unnamed protein product [Soboliphyme baturini]